MLECQAWILVVLCPTTRLLNLQVAVKIDAGGIIGGITMLVCETGQPKHMFVDQDSAIVAALTNAEVDVRDLQQRIHKEKRELSLQSVL